MRVDVDEVVLLQEIRSEQREKARGETILKLIRHGISLCCRKLGLVERKFLHRPKSVL